MPRPQCNRIINEPPVFTGFKPMGVRNYKLQETTLTLDEFEAIRLTDYLKLSHEDAAKKMNISRPTFTRLIEKARFAMADFLINGKRLSITGGKIHFKNNVIECLDCKLIFRVEIEKKVRECPKCKSANLENLAVGLGHGECCREHYES